MREGRNDEKREKHLAQKAEKQRQAEIRRTCNVEGCATRCQGRVPEADEYGAAGQRCAKHGYGAFKRAANAAAKSAVESDSSGKIKIKVEPGTPKNAAAQKKKVTSTKKSPAAKKVLTKRRSVKNKVVVKRGAAYKQKKSQ